MIMTSRPWWWWGQGFCDGSPDDVTGGGGDKNRNMLDIICGRPLRPTHKRVLQLRNTV